MPIQILMPALSPTMTEGSIVKWLKSEGDNIVSGDILAEIETDKATMELEAVEEGILGKILVTDGSNSVAVNQPIAIILESGEDIETIGDFVLDTSQDSKAEDVEVSKNDSEESKDLPQHNKIVELPVSEDSERVLASPLARRLAGEYNIPLAVIEGSGPGGRIIKKDIEEASVNQRQVLEKSNISEVTSTGKSVVPKEPLPPAVMEGVSSDDYTEIPHSNMRKVIAKRLTGAARDIPHFFLSTDCQIDGLLDLRMQLNEKSPAAEGKYKISINDFIIAGVASAMKKVPMVNVSWTEQAMRQYKNIDIAVAVATDGGLITPVIRRADQKGLVEISREIRDLAMKAKSGKLLPEEYQGGGFTISNLGMYGVKNFCAIINPPQSCILAVGAAEQRPTVKRGAITTSTIMSCTLSVDHRAVDGAMGAQFLDAYKAFIEDPISMML